MATLGKFRYANRWKSFFAPQQAESVIGGLEQRDRTLEVYLDNMATQIGIASSIPGPVGPAGPTGPTGPGVPTGGVAGDVLLKNSGVDFDDGWSNAVPLGTIIDIATASILGRVTAGTGNIEVLTTAQVRTLLALVIGTNVQAWDADLDTVASLTATTDSFMQAKAGAWAARTIAQVKTDLRPDIPVICTSGTRPGSPGTGQRIYETDTFKELTWNGTAWVIMFQPATSFTVVRRGGGVADTLGTGGGAGRTGTYTIVGGTCFFAINWQFGTSGAVANVGVTTFDAPVGFNASAASFSAVGSGAGFQAGARYNYQVLRDGGSSGFQLYAPGQVTSASPGAVTFSDQWGFTGSYPI